ncbi:MAG: peptidoglycan DD-metalloendopeptidase family protein [Oscillospiraceae bacterium]|nr:peptidoglycan DD-metalloendopeptidase family protein [Oscillospiraceae bacterium]
MAVFKFLYQYISDLGLFVFGIFKSLFLRIAAMFKRLFRRSEKTKARAKKAVIKICAAVLVVSVITSAVFLIFADSKKVPAISVTLDGESVGILDSFSDLENTKTLVFNETGGTQSLDISYSDIKTDACNIESSEALFERIMARAFPEYERVCEISIGSSPFCRVADVSAAKAVIQEYMDKQKAAYPNASVTFSNEVTFNYVYKKTGTDDIWSTDRLRLMLNTLEPLSARHVECEKTLSALDYDTVEIETNTLFIGDSRVRREGKDGQEFVIDIVTYNGDKKVLSQHLTSLVVTPPVSKVIERGMRAESISMGSYTVTQTKGTFCWPVVGLYQITSQFGYRSLGYHHGIDISGAGASGSLVVAGASGTVTEAGWSTTGYGNYVIIDHGNGVETLYGHMLDNSISVSKGDTVYKGQAIGRVGDTGYSFGAHLHFEVRINGNRVDPARYIGLE